MSIGRFGWKHVLVVFLLIALAFSVTAKIFVNSDAAFGGPPLVIQHDGTEVQIISPSYSYTFLSESQTLRFPPQESGLHEITLFRNGTQVETIAVFIPQIVSQTDEQLLPLEDVVVATQVSVAQERTMVGQPVKFTLQLSVSGATQKSQALVRIPSEGSRILVFDSEGFVRIPSITRSGDIAEVRFPTHGEESFTLAYEMPAASALYEMSNNRVEVQIVSRYSYENLTFVYPTNESWKLFVRLQGVDQEITANSLYAFSSLKGRVSWNIPSVGPTKYVLKKIAGERSVLAIADEEIALGEFLEIFVPDDGVHRQVSVRDPSGLEVFVNLQKRGNRLHGSYMPATVGTYTVLLQNFVNGTLTEETASVVVKDAMAVVPQPLVTPDPVLDPSSEESNEFIDEESSVRKPTRAARIKEFSGRKSRLVDMDGEWTFRRQEAYGKQKIRMRGKEVELRSEIIAAEVQGNGTAEVSLAVDGPVNAIVKCSQWDFVSGSCSGEWNRLHIPFDYNGTHVVFSVDSFSAYGGAYLEIINPVSYLHDGDEWTVIFNASGQADLTIYSPNGTWWEYPEDDTDTFAEMQFINWTCGDVQLEPLVDTGSGYVNITDLTGSTPVYGFRIPSYNCTQLSRFTNIVHTAGYVELNFTYGDVSAMAYDPTPACGATIVASVTFDADMSCDGTAITIGASNIAVDCAGYNITWGIAGGSPIMGINNSGGHDNIHVENCTFIEGNSSTGSTRSNIYFSGGSSSVIKNNTFITVSTSSQSVALLSSSNNNIVSDANFSTIGISLNIASSSSYNTFNNLTSNSSNAAIALGSGSSSNNFTDVVLYGYSTSFVVTRSISMVGSSFNHFTNVYMNGTSLNSLSVSAVSSNPIYANHTFVNAYVDGKPLQYNFSLENQAYSNQDYTSTYGLIACVFCRNITYTNITVGTEGFFFSNSSAISIINSTINATGGSGLSIIDGSSTNVSTSTINSSFGFMPVYFSGQRSSIISNSSLFTHLYLTTTSNIIAHTLQMPTLSSVMAGGGIVITSSSLVSVYSSNLTGSSANGIQIVSSTDSHIENNNVSMTSSGNGISLASTSNRSVLLNNYLRGSSAFREVTDSTGNTNDNFLIYNSSAGGIRWTNDSSGGFLKDASLDSNGSGIGLGVNLHIGSEVVAINTSAFGPDVNESMNITFYTTNPLTTVYHYGGFSTDQSEIVSLGVNCTSPLCTVAYKDANKMVVMSNVSGSFAVMAPILNITSTADGVGTYANFTHFFVNLTLADEAFTGATCRFSHDASGNYVGGYNMSYNSSILKYEAITDGGYLKGHMPNLPVGNFSVNITCDYHTGNISAIHDVTVWHYDTTIENTNTAATAEPNVTVPFYANFSFTGSYPRGFRSEIGETIWKTTDKDTSDASYRVLAADIDEDGKLDDLLAAFADDIYGYDGNGTSIFNFVASNTFEYDVEILDGDSDDILEYFVLEGNFGFIRIYNNTGSLIQSVNVGHTGQDITRFARDADGKENDFYAAIYSNPNSSFVLIYNSSGTPSWTNVYNYTHYCAADCTPAQIMATDADADGREDDAILGVGFFADGHLVAINETGGILWNTSFLGTYGGNFELLDLDHDKDLDVIEIHDFEAYAFDYYGRGIRTFNTSNAIGSRLDLNERMHEVTKIDADNDGWEDEYLIGDSGSFAGTHARIMAFDNDSRGIWNFSILTDGADHDVIHSISVEDLTADGQKEIIFEEHDSGNVFILNRTGGLMTNRSFFNMSNTTAGYLYGSSPGIAPLDVNGDGIKEVAVMHEKGFLHIIQPASCQITYNNSPSIQYNMTWNADTFRWENNQSFESLGEIEYNITCSKGGYTTTTNSFTIEISEEEPVVCGNVGASITLNQNVTSPASCFNITAHNIVIDCAGYSVNYSTADTLGYGINNSDGYDNLTIKNCNLWEGAYSTASKYGILFSGGQNSLINNTNITTRATTSHGINLAATSHFNNLSHLTIHTYGSQGHGIAINEADDTNISYSTFTVESGLTYGLSVTNSYFNSTENNFTSLSGAAFSFLASTSDYTRSSISTTNRAEGYPILYHSGLSHTTALEHQNASEVYGFMVCASCTNVTYNNITLSHDGFQILLGSNVTVENSTMLTNNSFGAYYYNTPDSKFRHNFVNTTATASVAGVWISTFNRAIVDNNTVFTSGSSVYGIRVTNTAHNATISRNRVLTTGAGAYGIYVVTTAHDNLIESNHVNTTGSSAPAIHVGTTTFNTIIRDNFLHVTGASYGIHLFSNAHRTNITNNNITSLSPSAGGIYLASTENTTLLNNSIIAIGNAILDTTSNSFINSIIYQNSYGEIRWSNTSNGGFLRNINVSYNLTFPGSIDIGPNYVSVDTNQFGSSPLINSSANITFTQPTVRPIRHIKVLNSFSILPSVIRAQGTNCTYCNYISYTSAFTFNTTHFSSHSLQDNHAPTHSTPILNSTFGTNTSLENLTVHPQSVDDEDLDPVKNITDWQKFNISLMLLNMPFEGGSTNGSTVGPSNGTTRDYSTFGNNGTVLATSTNPGPYFNATGGYDGFGAYDFKTNSSIFIPTFYGPRNNESRTIEARLKTTDADGTSLYSNVYFSYGVVNGDGNRYNLGIHLGDVIVRVSETSVLRFNTDINDGDWHHVVVVTNGTKLKDHIVFVDGVRYNWFSSNNEESNLETGQANATIGSANGEPYFFNGTIDELRVYNRSLSYEQILQLFNNRTQFMIRNETRRGETWQACVTVADNYTNGSTQCSNELHITNSLPIHSTPILNSSSLTNTTSENLSVYAHNLFDADADAVKNITAWYLNNMSFSLLHLPFEAGSSTTFTEDYSGLGNNGTPKNTPSWDNESGHDGFGAYTFDGVSEYINLTITDYQIFNFSGSTTGFTVAAWIKPNDLVVNDGDIISHYNTVGGDHRAWLLQVRSGVARFNVCADGTLASCVFATGTTEVNESGQWYHVVGTWNLTHAQVYVNGVADDATPPAVSSIYSLISRSIRIGEDVASEHFNGTIDDVMIFNRSLSIEQIQLLNASSTHTLAKEETEINDVWYACVTPNDGFADATTKCTDSMVILSSYNLTIETTADVQTAYVNYTKINATLRDGADNISDASCRVAHQKTGTYVGNYNMSYNSSTNVYEITADGSYLAGHMPTLPAGNYNLRVLCERSLINTTATKTILVSNYSTGVTVALSESNPAPNETVLFSVNYSRDEAFPVAGMGVDIGQILWNTTDHDASDESYKAGFVDLDKDGFLNDPIAAFPTTIRAYFGNGTLKFSYNPSNTFIRDFAAIDADNDGYKDHYALEENFGSTRVRNNTGGFIFSRSIGEESRSVATFAFDNDGIENDFIIATNGGKAIIYNTTSGNSWTNLWNGSFTSSVAELRVADLNGDGLAQEFIAQRTDGSLHAFNKTGGLLWQTANLGSAVGGSFDLIDIDHDGDTEVVVVSDTHVRAFDYYGKGIMLFNTSNAVWSRSMPNDRSDELRKIDIDSDGEEDEFIVPDTGGFASTTGRIMAFDNSSTGIWNFSFPGDGSDHQYMDSIVAEDIDADGYEDIIFADNQNGSLHILNIDGDLTQKNTFIGIIPSRVGYFYGISPGIATGDANRDGILDIGIIHTAGFFHMMQQARCQIVFNDTPSTWYNMTWNVSTRNWEYNRSFERFSQYSYNVSCEKGGYETQISLATISTIPAATCGNISSSITLTTNLSTNSTCMNVTAHNVAIDCDGHSITYGIMGTAGDVGVNITGFDNVSIHNCFFIEGSSSGASKHGVAARHVRNLTINLTNATTIGTTSSAFYFSDMNNSYVGFSNTSTSGSTGYSINLLGTRYSLLTQLNVSASGSNGRGISSDSATTYTNFTHMVVSGQTNVFGITLDGTNNLVAHTNITTISGDGLQLITDYSNIHNLTSTVTGSTVQIFALTVGTANQNNITDSSFYTEVGPPIDFAASSDARATHYIRQSYAQGLPIYYNVSLSNTVALQNFDASSTYGLIMCSVCTNVSYINVTMELGGFLFVRTDDSAIINSTIVTDRGGLVLYGSAYNEIEGNYINNTDYYALFMDAGSTNNNISANRINNSGYMGVYLTGAANYNNLTNNFVQTYGTGNGADAIVLYNDPDGNELRNNYAEANATGGEALRIATSSQNNRVLNNTLFARGGDAGTTTSALLLENGNLGRTIVANNTFIAYGGYGVDIDNNVNNTFFSTNVYNGSAGAIFDATTAYYSQEFEFRTDEGAIVWTNKSLGSFLSSMNVTAKMSLNNSVFIGRDAIAVNISELGQRINDTANVTLYNVPFLSVTNIIRLNEYSMDADTIRASGTPCDGTYCEQISYTRPILTFNVSRFSSYAVNGTFCGNVDSSITMTQDESVPGNCMNITASNIVIDCAGHTITYGTAGSSGVGINISHASNVTINNCTILEGSSSGSGRQAIIAFNASNLTINNSYLYTQSSSSQAFLLSLVNNSRFEFTNLTTRGSSAYGFNAISSNYNTYLNLTTRVLGTNARANFITSGSWNNLTSLNATATDTGITLSSDNNFIKDANVTATTHAVVIVADYNRIESSTFNATGAASASIGGARYNNFTGNSYFSAIWNSFEFTAATDADANNSFINEFVEGLPLYYNFSLKNMVVLQNMDLRSTYGAIMCSLCSNVSYINISLAKEGFTLVRTNDSIFENNTLNITGGIAWYSDGYSQRNLFRNNTVDSTIYAVYFIGTNNYWNRVEANTLVTERVGITFTVGAGNNNITHNRILTKTSTSAYGISIPNGADNIVVINNTISTSTLSSVGIQVGAANENTHVENNTITTTGGSAYGIHLSAQSNPSVDGKVIGNTVVTSGTSAYGIFIDVGTNRTTIKNNNVTAIAGAYRDGSLAYREQYFYFDSEFGIVNWTNSSAGGLLRNINITGNLTYPGDMFIGSNVVSLNTTSLGALINSTANITLYDVGYPSVSQILKLDDYTTSAANVRASGTVCSDCNILSYTAGTLVFNVTSFSSYSANGTYCGDVNVSMTLTQDENVSGTCFQMKDANLSIDCGGYTVAYGTGGLGYGVNDSLGYDNINISNCNFVHGGTTTSSHGIYLSAATNVKVDNTNISTQSTSSAGVYAESISSGLKFFNGNVTTTGATNAYGIFATGSSSYANIENSSFSILGSSLDFGLYMVSSGYHNITNNTVVVTAKSNPSHGINFNQASNSRIINNTFITETGEGVSIQGTGGGVGFVMIDNTNDGLPILFNDSLYNAKIENISINEYSQIICAQCANVTYNNISLGLDGIQVPLGNNISLEHSSINATKGDPIFINDADNITVRHSYLRARIPSGYGIRTNAIMTGISIINNTLDSIGSYAIYFGSAATYSHVADNRINGTIIGMYIGTGSGGSNLTNNSLYVTSSCIQLTDTQYISVSHNNCTSTGSNQALYINGADDINFSYNSFNKTGTSVDTIYLFNSANRSRFVNNNITGGRAAIADDSGDYDINYLIYNNSHGEIFWSNTSSGGFLRSLNVSGNLTFPGTVHIDENVIALNTTQFGNNPLINTTANITLFNIDLSTIRYIIALENFSTSATTIQAYGSNCTYCQYNTWSGTTFTFNTTHFSSFSLVDNYVPTHATPILNSSWDTNTSSENLTVYPQSVSDQDSDPVKNITTWYMANATQDLTSIQVLNMPFEGGSTNGSDVGPANGTTSDYSDYAQTGVVIGNTTNGGGAVWNATGGYDQFGAYMFDGLEDNLKIANFIGPLNNESRTVSAWLKTTVVGGPSTGQTYLSYGTTGGGVNRYSLSIFSGDVTVRASSSANVRFNTNLNDGEWHHVAVVTNGTRVKDHIVFLDGTRFDYFQATNEGSNLQTAQGDLLIGTELEYDNDSYFNGSIDDVQIFNRSLTYEQIVQLFNNRTQFMIRNETRRGETWQACVTPVDQYTNGSTLCSNNLTVKNSVPTHDMPILNSTLGTNLTTENLTVYPQNAHDLDGDIVNNISVWYKNNVSIMLLYLAFDNNVTNHTASNAIKDYSGFGNNASGTSVGQTPVWNNSGANGGTYIFDGEDDEIRIPDNETLDPYTNDFTLSVWVNLRNYTSQGGIFQKGSANFYYGISIFTSGRWGFGARDGPNAGNISSVNSDASTTIPTSTWVHLAATVDRNANISIYQSGVRIGSVSAENITDSIENTAALQIGRHVTSINGSLDQPIIFNRSLTAEQILALNSSRMETLVSDELEDGDIWRACVTPNDGYEDGTTRCSENITVQGAIDLQVNNGNFTADDLTPMGYQNITLQAFVRNLGGLASTNITVQFRERNSTGTLLGTSNINISASGVVQVNATYLVKIGLNEFWVGVDPIVAEGGNISENDETNNEAYLNISLGSFHTFYGNQTLDRLVLHSNESGRTLFYWNVFNGSGNIYVTDVQSSVDFNRLQALGRNSTGASINDDFIDADIVMNMSNLTENMTNTWENSVLKNFTLFGRNVYNVSVVNSSNSSNFQTGVLWDMSDDTGDGEFDYTTSENLIFISTINQDKIGQYGTYDLELKIPSRLSWQAAPNDDQVVFYVELTQ